MESKDTRSAINCSHKSWQLDKKSQKWECQYCHKQVTNKELEQIIYRKNDHPSTN